jgi:hypothetical protein
MPGNRNFPQARQRLRQLGDREKACGSADFAALRLAASKAHH